MVRMVYYRPRMLYVVAISDGTRGSTFFCKHACRWREVAALEERQRDLQVREPQHVRAQVDLHGSIPARGSLSTCADHRIELLSAAKWEMTPRDVLNVTI